MWKESHIMVQENLWSGFLSPYLVSPFLCLLFHGPLPFFKVDKTRMRSCKKRERRQATFHLDLCHFSWFCEGVVVFSMFTRFMERLRTPHHLHISIPIHCTQLNVNFYQFILHSKCTHTNIHGLFCVSTRRVKYN